jgi:hypothetical protein
MIDYKHFHFAAPPRTGSTWFMKAASIVGLGDASKVLVHTPFQDDSALRVSLVRRPEDWLVSCFVALKGGVIGVDSVDRLKVLNYSSFPEFFESYLELGEGILSGIIRAYQADSYLRTEDLPWSFLELCGSLSRITDNQRVAVLGLNSQNPSKSKPRINDYQRLMIRKYEAEIYDQFEYF